MSLISKRAARRGLGTSTASLSGKPWHLPSSVLVCCCWLPEGRTHTGRQGFSTCICRSIPASLLEGLGFVFWSQALAACPGSRFPTIREGQRVLGGRNFSKALSHRASVPHQGGAHWQGVEPLSPTTRNKNGERPSRLPTPKSSRKGVGNTLRQNLEPSVLIPSCSVEFAPAMD